MGHLEVPLLLDNEPLNIFGGTFKSVLFTHASKGFWGTLNRVSLKDFKGF
jgi:hypothetical protein